MSAGKVTAINDKMALWRAVEKTDPNHTKHVNQRGGFTAIAAHYQVMRATEQFGPVGVGWGYENGEPIFQDGLVIVPVTIWHGSRDNRFGPLYGAAEMLPKTKNGPVLDSDAPKKAATDGLTKGLSHLGFNADVFLGRFDDNKYVERLRGEFADHITSEQAKELDALIEETSAKRDVFLKFYKIDKLEHMPSASFDHAKASLLAKLPKGEAA